MPQRPRVGSGLAWLWRALACIVLTWLCIGPARAALVTFAGALDDAANPALRGPDLGAAAFGSDADIANNVALHAFSLSVAGAVHITSTGFALGGVDPYLSLFIDTAGGQTFLASNYDQAFSVGGDFDLTLSLLAGDYVLALGAWANLSFAENLGTGVLGDGFVALGSAGALGNGRYAVTLTLHDDSTRGLPVPSTLALILPLLLLFGLHARLHERKDPMIRRVGRVRRLAPLVLLFGMAAGEAGAQVRPAYVRDVDRPSAEPVVAACSWMIPARERVLGLGGAGCVAYKVPAGKLFVLEQVSYNFLRFSDGEPASVVHPIVRGHRSYTYMPRSELTFPGSNGEFSALHAVRGYYPSGTDVFVEVQTPVFALQFFYAEITGYLVTTSVP